MGKASFFVNSYACLWTLFVTIIFILPTVRPVTANNMNYAIAFLALIFVFALVYWFIAGRRFYSGPLIEADVGEEDSQNNGSGSSGDYKPPMDSKA